MAKKPRIEVDEELMRQMIAGQAPLTSKVVRRISDEDPEDTQDAPQETPDAEEQSSPSDDRPESRHRRMIPVPDYERTFLSPANYDSRARCMSVRLPNANFWKYSNESAGSV